MAREGNTKAYCRPPMTSLKTIAHETASLIRELPGKGAFTALLAGWVALFGFFGNNTLGYIDTPSLFTWLANAYDKYSDDSYCALIPVLVAGLLIWKRRELKEISKESWWPGLMLFAGGIAIHLVGYLIQQPRISVLGFIVGLYGLTGMVWGRQWLATTFFPMFLLLFMIPVSTLQDQLTLPLRLFVTKASVTLGNLFLNLGYQAQGSNVLSEFGRPVFDVAPACSGIRSLVSLFVLASVYAFTRFERNWKRVLVILAAIPLAVLGNLLRLFIVLIVGRAVNFHAGAIVEQKLGVLTFIVALGGLFLLGRKLGECMDATDGNATPSHVKSA